MHLNVISIHIKEPCTQNWDAMDTRKQGAYCKSCCKEVIDFSVRTEKEIVDYFENRKGEQLCGRFKKEHLNKPLISISPDVLSMNIPLWKKFLAILFICFSGLLTGCENDQSNADIPLPPASNIFQSSVAVNEKELLHVTKNDTTDFSTYIVGNIIVKDEDKIQTSVIQEIFSPKK